MSLGYFIGQTGRPCVQLVYDNGSLIWGEKVGIISTSVASLIDTHKIWGSVPTSFMSN